MVPRIETILMPTDFSSTSGYALEYASVLARQSGAVLHLLYVVAFPIEVTSSPESYWVELAGLRDQLRADAERELAAQRQAPPRTRGSSVAFHGRCVVQDLAAVALERAR